MNSATSIADYLDDLAELLAGSGVGQRSFLLEVEAHLQDRRDARIAAGESPAEAESAAIRAFGTPREVARAASQGAWRSARGPVALAAVLLFLRLLAIGMVVVGVAGALTRVIASFGLVSAMYGLPGNVVMPAASCAHWLEVQPRATTCVQAGTLEASDDLTSVALLVGILGLLLAIPMGVLWWRSRGGASVLPPTLGPALAAAGSGTTALGFFVLGATNAVVSATWGQGMWLTYAACATATCVASIALLMRGVRRSYGSAATTRAVRP